MMWLACEKLVYPEWTNYLLQQNPMLTLGLDRDFFRIAAAFVELGLGFMFVLGLCGRSLSIVITITFADDARLRQGRDHRSNGA